MSIDKSKEFIPREVLKLIPKGFYCHASYKNDNDCPFWFGIKGRPKQENGWCVLLGKGDYEINREHKTYIQTKFIKGKRKKTKIKCGPDNPSMFSLLWDKCKGCNIKSDNP